MHIYIHTHSVYQAALRGQEVVRPERVHLKLNLRSELRLRLVLPPSVPSAGSTQPARAGVSILFFFQMAEISSSFGGGGRGWGLTRREGDLKPRLWPTAGRGVHFPPVSSGKLARLMPRQRGGGADGVSRWPSGIGRHWPAMARPPCL